MECRAYVLCLDGKSRGHLGQGRKVPSATGRNLPRMHKTEKEAEESRMKFLYSYLRDTTLASCGLRVFRDETAIDEGTSITQEIREGIASSKLLLAFYSSTYPSSGPCQEEIISAWLAAQHAGEPPQARVRIINPEPG